MPARLPFPASAPAPSVPLGILAWLNQTRIQLPLRQIDCRFDVAGEFAEVEIAQVFHQTARQSLDITYTFPLPAGAAVYRCEVKIGGRTLCAKVMEKQEARRVAAEQKAAGHRTALVEVERDNLFTLELGNAAPDDVITITLGYLAASERLGASLSLRIPFCPGMRYIPGKPLLRANRGRGSVDDTDEVPDASRITPPRIGGDHPDAAQLFVQGVLDASEVALGTLSSPTHPVIVRPDGNLHLVRLAAGQDLPDRDFILRWQEPVEKQTAMHAWTCRDAQWQYALLQLRAPQKMERPGIADGIPQEIYFLVDRSGSMSGAKWLKSAEALRAFISELAPNDSVWITFFESSFQDFSDAPMPRDEILADPGLRDIASMGTGGGTELLPALKHVLQKMNKYPAIRRRRIILITDGQVGNEPAVLDLMKEQKEVSVHCFGIDDAVNDAFLKTLATRQGGRCALMTPQDDIVGAVKALAVTLRQPVLTNISLPQHVESADETLRVPDLHAGEVILLPVRCPLETAQVTLSAYDAQGHPWAADFHCADNNGTPAPRLAWARQRIAFLLSSQDQRAALALAVEHNLVCEGASFIAWDEAEKVPVAQQEVYQPSVASGGSTQMLSRSLYAPPAAACAPLMQMEEDALYGTMSAPAPSPKKSRARPQAPMSPPPPPLGSDEGSSPTTASAGFAMRSSRPGRPETDSLAPRLNEALVTRGNLPARTAHELTRMLERWSRHLLSWGRTKLLVALLKEIEAASPDQVPGIIIAFARAHLSKRQASEITKLLHRVPDAADPSSP